MKLKQYSPLIAILGLALTTGFAHSATIVYNFDSASAAVTSNDFGSGVAGSDVTVAGADAVIGASPDSGWNGAYDTNSAHLGLGRGPDGGPGTLVWDVAIPFGVTIDLTTLGFDFDHRSNNGSGSVLRQDWTLSISTGSGTPTTNSNAAIAAGIGAISTPENITLSGLTGLTNETVTFTIAFDSGVNGELTGGNAVNRRTVIDNIVLTGAIAAVPEPSTTALLGLGGLALILRRRK
jgi:hypothetical protein